MAQVIEREKSLLEKIQNLTPKQQEELLNFIDFLQYKAQNPEILAQQEQRVISAYEAAKDFAGCLDDGPSDLSTNKKYLENMGKV